MDTPGQATDARFIKPEKTYWLAKYSVWIGAIWAIASFAYLINGITQTNGHVEVDVMVSDQSLQDQAEGVKPPIELNIDVDEDELGIVERVDRFELAVFDSTAREQALSRTGPFLVGLVVLLGALTIRPVLLAISSGLPFSENNASRLRRLGMLIIAAGLVAPVPGIMAANLVLDRIGISGPDAAIVANVYELPVEALVIGVFLFILAEAFGRGSIMATELEGVV